MDILIGKAGRQLIALRADVDAFTSSSSDGANMAALQGQISASLMGLSKTLNDVDEMIKREMSMDRRSLYKEKVKALRQDYERVQKGYDQTRAALKEKERQRNKEALLSTYTPSPSVGGRSSQQELTESLLKERENRVLDYSSSQLDSFISIGNLTLESMRTQGRTMKSAQRRLLDAANSLGISQSIIRVIQRKSSQDRAIFYGGIVVTFVVIYLCWKYLV